MQAPIEIRDHRSAAPAGLSGWADLEALARRIAPATVDPEDLAQDARIAAWQAGEPIHAPRSWLRGVLRHRAIDRHRAQTRRQRREQDVGEMPPPEARSPEQAAELREQLGVLASALEQLDPIDRRLVIGRYYEERSAAELAQELGLVASTARTRVSRAMARLRKDLDERQPSWSTKVSALLGLPASSLHHPGLATTIIMSKTTLQVGLGLAAAAAATVAVWIGTQGPSEASEPAATTAVQSQTDAPSPAPSSAPLASATADEHDRAEPTSPRATEDAPRRALREKLRSLRAARDPLPVPVADVATRDYLQQIRDTNRQMAEQLELFDDCLGTEPAGRSGTLVAEGDLIGEVGVGMLLDDVSITTDAVGDPELGECVRESMLAMELETPQQPYYQHYRFTFDFDEGTQRIAAMPTEAQVAEVIARFPEIPTGPYASLVDDDPDDVALGLMPWQRGATKRASGPAARSSSPKPRPKP